MSEQEMWLALPGVEKAEKAELLMGLARAASIRGSHGHSLELAKAALAVYEELGATAPTSDVANCHWGIGFALRALKESDKAMEEIDLAIKLYREANDPFVDNLLRTRASWSAELKDWDGTLAANIEAVRQNEIEGNPEWEAKSWLNVGFTYNHMMRFEDALAAFGTARNKFLKLKMVPEVARCDRWISDCYAELGNGVLAYEHARRSMNISELMKERLPIMFSEYVLGKSLTILGEFEDAERHLNNSYNAAVQCEASEMDWDFIVKVQTQLISVLRLQDRTDEADQMQTRIQSVQEVIEP
jgi:tetratricopeptide (TPR) repeat protein